MFSFYVRGGQYVSLKIKMSCHRLFGLKPHIFEANKNVIIEIFI